MRLLFPCLLLAVSMLAHAAPNCAACHAGSANFDKGAGLCLPAAIEGLESVAYSAERQAGLRAYRNSVAAGYNRPQHQLAITSYLYDRADDSAAGDANEKRALVAEIMHVHPNATLEQGGATSLTVGGKPSPGVGGLFTWVEDGNDIASFYWLMPRGSRYLKIRATYVRPIGGEGEAMSSTLKAVHEVAENFCAASPI